MLKVDIAEAQQRLPELINAARRGTEVYVTERGRRVARIAPVVPPLGDGRREARRA